ncbi:MAG: divalent-cation tolerance protein CutA [Nitrospiraceae bacterium]|nr:divalent-cation tolerance protein CutA [Nitrospiraceae bacterium]MDA8325524.1 divalent-cation tolerance protein CutA [Nitrospiraceae bacterium]
MSEPIVVFITAANEEEAARIAGALVGESLAGCVNIIRTIRSIYSWQGRVEDETESLLIAKTRRELFERLCRRVKELHSYQVPEVIALPIADGLPEYISWLEDVTRGAGA